LPGQLGSSHSQTANGYWCRTPTRQVGATGRVSACQKAGLRGFAHSTRCRSKSPPPCGDKSEQRQSPALAVVDSQRAYAAAERRHSPNLKLRSPRIRSRCSSRSAVAGEKRPRVAPRQPKQRSDNSQGRALAVSARNLQSCERSSRRSARSRVREGCPRGGTVAARRLLCEPLRVQ
jgi:hypothetical protein